MKNNEYVFLVSVYIYTHTHTHTGSPGHRVTGCPAKTYIQLKMSISEKV